MATSIPNPYDDDRPLPGDDDQRGPSLDETSPALIEQLTRLGNQYGIAGVARTARQLLAQSKNVSHRVPGDPRPCTCSPDGLTWEADCPRHAELVARSVLRERRMADDNAKAGVKRTRDVILETAATAISGDREDVYGSAADGFARAGVMWQQVLGVPVSAHQVAICMTLLKISRLVNSPDHGDSWIDGAGYLALGGEIATT